jgi:ferrous iron transport protein B
MALIVSGGISGGCAVPGVLATRTLRDTRERIATLLVVPFMNCGAKLPVFAVLIGAFFSEHKARMMFILTLLSWAFALFAAKILRSTVLRGPKTPFVMELPPYRLPTLKGLLIHTWERTWHYIKKAGTVILAFSILLWAMMTFPGLPEADEKAFEDRRHNHQQALLTLSELERWVKGEKDLAELNGLFDAYHRAATGGDVPSFGELEQRPLSAMARAAALLEAGQTLGPEIDGRHVKAAYQYLKFRREMIEIDNQEQQAALKHTAAGYIGQRLESLTRPLGFDYRINIALIGGFAAKEVVVSTLGTAYSLGEVATDETGSLSERLKQDPNWNPLRAFSLLVFTMLYVPCFVTVISIRRESSWAWAGFSIAFNLLAAYFVALIVSQGGEALGIGV